MKIKFNERLNALEETRDMACHWERLRTPNRSWRPVLRVRAALTRLSRDKWLSPTDVRNAAIRLALHCSNNPTWTADRATPGACHVVGMLKGEPPATPQDPDYKQFLKTLNGAKRDEGAKAELLLLNLTIKRISNGR